MSSSDTFPGRRRLIKGVAWSVPAAVVATSSPVLAASPPTFDCGARTFSPTPPTTSSANAVTRSWTVPSGVTEICIEADGGGGGGRSTGTVGGSGARVFAKFNVSPNDVLTLVVAAGGSRISVSGGTPQRVVGGGGYGKGGDAGYPSGGGWPASRSQGGSGGGASAVLLNDVPILIAGGGGGASGATREDWDGYRWSLGDGPGGAAEAAGTSAETSNARDSRARATAEGGGGGLAGQGGAGGPAGMYDIGNLALVGADLKPGLSGESGFEAAGADGVLTQVSNSSMVSAAGGGGYGGGGSGGSTSVEVRNPSNSSQWGTTSLAGGAGGGGNYVAALAGDVSTGLANNGSDETGSRNPGRVTIFY